MVDLVGDVIHNTGSPAKLGIDVHSLLTATAASPRRCVISGYYGPGEAILLIPTARGNRLLHLNMPNALPVAVLCAFAFCGCVRFGFDLREVNGEGPAGDSASVDLGVDLATDHDQTAETAIDLGERDAACDCSIQGACIADGIVHPTNPCLVCDPARSSVDWSVAPSCASAELDRISGSLASSADSFGASVRIQGDRAVVGATSDLACGPDTGIGAVYVFEKAVGGPWGEAAIVRASDEGPDQEFGRSVAIDGDRLLVGARGDTCLRNFAGKAYVFERQTDGRWLEVAQLQPTDSAQGDLFGDTLTLVGDTAVVTAFGANASYVFDRQSDGSWTQGDRLAPVAASPRSVALSPSGQRLVIGITAAGVGGTAYVYDRQPDNSWSQADALSGSDTATDDRFGISVALLEDRLIAGAFFHDPAGLTRAGAAYVFSFDGNVWLEEAKLVADDAASGAWFGVNVAIDGDRALVGAHRTDSDQGAAYVFERDGTTWNQLTRLVPAAREANSFFGFTGHLWQDRVILSGGPLSNGQGSVYLMQLR